MTTALRDAVFAALDKAVANGYGDFVRNDTTVNVAVDLLDCDTTFTEQYPQTLARDLLPHIKAWRDAHTGSGQ